MAASDSRWIKVAWKLEKSKEYNSLKTAAEEMISETGHALKFKDGGMELDGVLRIGDWGEGWGGDRGCFEERKRNVFD